MSKVPNIGPLKVVPMTQELVPVPAPGSAAVQHISGDNARVNPVPMELVLLDEIAGRTADLYDLISLTIPRGETFFTTIPVVGPSNPPLTEFHLGDAVLFSATLVNDGPNSIQFSVNHAWQNPGIVNSGETIRLNYNKATIYSLFFGIANNVAGAANIRLFGEY